MAQIKKQDVYTTLDKKTEIYSDFFTNLNPHPITGDLVRQTNENAVKRSIRNLLMTDVGERPFQPTLGTKLKQLLFEPMDDFTARNLQQEIINTINVHEPRARIEDVVITPDYDQNAYAVGIVFSLINKEYPIQLNISLSRVR